MSEAQRTMLVPGQGIVPRGRPVVDHKEYPKHMAHPQYQPGKPGPEIKSPHGFIYNAPGTPIRFPPVLVKDADQEAYHASLGYETIGKSDPAAFAKAVGHGTIPEQGDAYVPQEYPKWVLGKLVNSEAEEAKLRGVPQEIIEAVDRPALNESVSPNPLSHPSPYEDKTLEQLRIEDLEAKVGNLTDLLARALKEREDKPAVAKAKKPRKMPVLTEQQKSARSDAIKAGMARKKQLTESAAATEVADALIG